MKIIFQEEVGDYDTHKGGYVVQVEEDLFIATTFRKDQFGTHNSTFEYDNKAMAINFAKTGVGLD